MTEAFEDTLWEMIMDDELSAEVRVAAVDTHRRLPCMNTRDRFLELFRNQKIDSEVRIAAYLQMMRCPDYITIRIVRHCLQEEEVNQGIFGKLAMFVRIICYLRKFKFISLLVDVSNSIIM